jgi:peptide/nickel transport system substrate-binding protein
MFNRTVFRAAAVAVASLAWASASAQTIGIAIGSEPTTLDPQLRDDGGERQVTDNIFETLMVRDPAGTLGLGLAASEPVLVDPTTWEVKVREGVTFQNGEPFDAEAAAFSVNRVINPEFNSEQLSYFSTITGAEAVDATTLRITTSGPDPILPTRLYWLKMVPPIAAAEPGFAENPVGSGPYMFDSWSRGSSITLTANPDYWGGAPEIEEVEFRFIPEFGTRLSSLLSGEVDLITNLLPEFVEQVPQAFAVKGVELPIILLSDENEPVDDVRVRQALNYAVDKEALAEALYAGYADVMQGQLLAPSYFGFNPDVTGYPYDPEKARALIAEAGAEGAEVTLYGTSGRWVKDRELVEAVAAAWEEVGIKPDVRIVDFSEYLDRFFDPDNRQDAFFTVSSNELMDADRPFSAYYHMDGIGAPNHNERIAELVDQARTESDPEARAAMYHEAIQIAFDEALYVYLLHINDVYGASERLVWEPRVDGKLLANTMWVKE